MPRKFKSPHKEYRSNNFSTTRRPRSPSPKRLNYHLVAKTADDGKSRCTYINPKNGKRCHNKLELYPQFCKLHTMMIDNVYIDKSNVEGAGNGLFVGPYGFKKGDVIGIYSYPWNGMSLKTLQKRCDIQGESCWAYAFCESGDDPKTKCYDGLDIRSTLMRNINDAHKSPFRNNSYFEVIKETVYVIASRNIKPYKEILVDYGKSYFS
jgi:hypothetical protein